MTEVDRLRAIIESDDYTIHRWEGLTMYRPPNSDNLVIYDEQYDDIEKFVYSDRLMVIPINRWSPDELAQALLAWVSSDD